MRASAYCTPRTAPAINSAARGLLVLDSPVGLVAVLPVGMCQVSSVVMTADVGVKLRKGEEFAYFQFGGSDVVMLFESSVNAGLDHAAGRTLTSRAAGSVTLPRLMTMKTGKTPCHMQ